MSVREITIVEVDEAACLVCTANRGPEPCIQGLATGFTASRPELCHAHRMLLRDALLERVAGARTEPPTGPADLH